MSRNEELFEKIEIKSVETPPEPKPQVARKESQLLDLIEDALPP